MDAPERVIPQAPADSPEFHRFFDGSFVVDEQGKPLVVYHSGTFDPKENPVLKIGKTGMHWGTFDAAQERNWGKIHDDFVTSLTYERDEDTGRWHWDSDGTSSWMYNEEGFSSKADAEEDAEQAARAEANSAMESGWEGFPITAAWLAIKNPKVVPDAGAGWAKVIKQAKAEGHDGLIYQNRFEDRGSTSYVAFYPGQVKSVDNAGAFDPSSPSVLDGVRRRAR